MRITTRLVSGVLVAICLPAIISGLAGYWLLEKTASRVASTSTEALLNSERLQIQEIVKEKAQRVSGFLESYQKDVTALATQASLIIARYPQLTTSYLADLYPDKDVSMCREWSL